MSSIKSFASVCIKVINSLDLWVTFNVACVLRSTAAHSSATAEDALKSDLYCDDNLVCDAETSSSFIFIEASGPGVRLDGSRVPCSMFLPVD